MKNKFARIEILYARESNIAVIFRRGPTQWLQVLKWNTETDEIISGQWFKGRIYPKKSDLSPCGNYMIYFAAKFQQEQKKYAWTAISKPPFLTAIALWKKQNTFDGGGLFESSHSIYLNHKKENAIPEKDSNIKNLHITLNETQEPQIYDMESVKMKRDGWRWSKEKRSNTNEADIQISKTVDENTAIIHAGNKLKNHLYQWHCYIKHKDKLFRFDEYANIDTNQNQRILLSKDGCIYAIDKIENMKDAKDTKELLDNKHIRLIADLNNNKPYRMEALAEAQE